MQNDRLENNIQRKTFLQKIVVKKLAAPAVIIFLLLISIMISMVIARQGYVTGVIILCGVLALPAVYAVAAWPEFGIVALIVASFFINY